MPIQSQYFQLVEIETITPVVDTIDEYNTTVYETVTFEARVALRMDSSNETEDDRNTITNSYIMLCDPDVNIDKLSTVRWEDELGGVHVARVMGDPTQSMLRAQLHHLEVTLQEIRG